MKKIFTLVLIAVGTISVASAQSYKHQSNSYDGDKKMNNVVFQKSKSIDYDNTLFSYKAKQAKLEEINLEYNRKIGQVKDNPFISGRQKAKKIKMLQNEWREEISRVSMQYADNSHDFKNRDHDSHKW